MFKEEKGITLVALVITIIVLLILAGVSIALVVGNNGILGRATGAVDTTEQATARQEVELSIADAQVASYAQMASGTATDKATCFTPSIFTENCKTATSATWDASTKILTYVTKSGTTIKFTIDVDNFGITGTPTVTPKS